jgi:hypothetical protein
VSRSKRLKMPCSVDERQIYYPGYVRGAARTAASRVYATCPCRQGPFKARIRATRGSTSNETHIDPRHSRPTRSSSRIFCRGHGQCGRAQSSLRPGLKAGSRPNPGPQVISSSWSRTAVYYEDCCKTLVVLR